MPVQMLVEKKEKNPKATKLVYTSVLCVVDVDSIDGGAVAMGDSI